MTEKPVKSEEMTPEAASALEREIILHSGDPDYVLPGGRTVREAREAQAEKDAEDRKEAAEFWERSVKANTSQVETVAVRPSPAGGLTSSPAAVKPAETEGATGQGESTAMATLLPDGFPHRELLAGAGFNSVEKVGAAADEELIAVDGLAGARVKEIRAALKKLR